MNFLGRKYYKILRLNRYFRERLQLSCQPRSRLSSRFDLLDLVAKMGILGYRYYVLSVHLHNWGNPSYHNPLIMRCIKPRDHKHGRTITSPIRSGRTRQSPPNAGSQTHAKSILTLGRPTPQYERSSVPSHCKKMHWLQAILQSPVGRLDIFNARCHLRF